LLPKALKHVPLNLPLWNVHLRLPPMKKMKA
jgi:hypothetical protein